MTKTNKDVMTQSKTRVLGRLIKEAKPIWGWILLSSLIACASVFLALIAPLIMGKITDAIYDYWQLKTPIIQDDLIKNSLSLVLVYLGSSICSLSNMMILNNVVSRHFTCELRIKISAKIMRLPVKFVDSTPNGEIISRMTNDVSSMGNTIHNVLNLAIQGFLQLIGISIMMFRINPFMALIVLVLVPFSLVLSAVVAGKSEDHFGAGRKTAGKMYSFIEEDYTGFDTIKSFNLEETQNKEQARLAEEIRNSDCKGYFLSGIVQPIITFTNALAFMGICVLGGYLAINGKVSVGDVVAVIMYAKLFSSPLEGIAYGISMLQRAFASSRRVFNLFDEPEMPEAESDEVPSGKGDVEFRHVYFSYSPDKPLIEDLNLKVSAGQKVAIVGPTGGGKTTIVNLLMRFYDVDSGQIFIDGVDATKIDRKVVRNMFAMVLQDTWLYSGSVFDNIAYSRDSATREEVLEAGVNARIDHFVDTMPEGYDTIINEESTNISSGQKQLLTIARAYLADRKMLILDEATSNVDTRTELLIQESMDRLMQNKTSFVIAHRLSTIVDADIILVVNEGKIVETGTHKELMAKNGFYTEIYNSQYDLLN